MARQEVVVEDIHDNSRETALRRADQSTACSHDGVRVGKSVDTPVQHDSRVNFIVVFTGRGTLHEVSKQAANGRSMAAARQKNMG
jgi:hypothetical protein